ncbi:hypothetical protein RRSWK_05200 [Rhodopirellula sp. SWK7]|nr:hypothetical protein RRSWK_05200 [Rhodopirellula sp. SWK7]
MDSNDERSNELRVTQERRENERASLKSGLTLDIRKWKQDTATIPLTASPKTIGTMAMVRWVAPNFMPLLRRGHFA